MSKNSASAANMMWFRIKTTNSANLRRFISGPIRNAWGISLVKNSKILARLHDMSKITLHFLCCKSATWKIGHWLPLFSSTCMVIPQEWHRFPPPPPWHKIFKKQLTGNLMTGTDCCQEILLVYTFIADLDIFQFFNAFWHMRKELGVTELKMKPDTKASISKELKFCTKGNKKTKQNPPGASLASHGWT